MSDAPKKPKPKQVEQLAHTARDPIAGVASAVVMLLGLFGLLERWQVSADQLAVALGLLMTSLAGLFTWLEKRRRSDVAPEPEA